MLSGSRNRLLPKPLERGLKHNEQHKLSDEIEGLARQSTILELASASCAEAIILLEIALIGSIKDVERATFDPYAYYFAKGKSKGKSKGKKGMMLDAQAWLKGKSKGKSKGHGKDGFGSRNVNAYASDLFLGGLEVSDVMQAATASVSTSSPSVGMLDCGATASAAPEAIVRSLISAVRIKYSQLLAE